MFVVDKKNEIKRLNIFKFSSFFNLKTTVQSSEVPLPQEMSLKLKQSLENVVNALPNDLQSVLS